ncbi:hypothetical protein [Hydrogenophaga sp.]|uniref:hypothetical protein n=1 Tax=Hydrogenophaga sp. TaxID=1904254 RepID=UPI003D1051B3
MAVDLNRNRFESEGGVTLADVQNNARFEASSVSVSAGVGSQLGNSGAGVGTDKGSTRSTTVAAISGIAGHTSARTGDAETGLLPIFDKARVKAEVDAQVAITLAFTQAAPKAVASYAGSQERAIKQALETETDPARRAELQSELTKWEEGGQYRVALHTVAGALVGGVGGAMGAAASSAGANLLGDLQDGIEQGLKDLGVNSALAKGIAQGATALTAAGMGAVVGGGAGAATGASVDANNRQLHPDERKLAQELAEKSKGRYTAEQIENALRNAGNTQTGESVVAGMVVDPAQRDAIYDKGAVWTVGESGTLVQVLPPQPDAELVVYIRQNTGQTYDWYTPSRGGIANDPNIPRDRLTGRPLDDQGRYSQTVVLDGKVYEPKYHPCATTDCIRTGANLDMADPSSQAYVKALDKQVFKDIGKGATVGSLVTPVGVPGRCLEEWG